MSLALAGSQVTLMVPPLRGGWSIDTSLQIVVTNGRPRGGVTRRVNPASAVVEPDIGVLDLQNLGGAYERTGRGRRSFGQDAGEPPAARQHAFLESRDISRHVEIPLTLQARPSACLTSAPRS
jgi:hypothetical protein